MEKKKFKFTYYTVLQVIAVICLALAIYVTYIFIAFKRQEDNIQIETINNIEQIASADDKFGIITWNIGFGAYTPDFYYRDDGGDMTRAASENAVYENMDHILAVLDEHEPDFVFLQEIDEKATRTYNINEIEYIQSQLGDYASIVSINYNSPYYIYPFNSPLGKTKCGIMTLSDTHIESTLRRSLPVDETFLRTMDVDRSYTVSRVPLDNGKTLCLYNTQLSDSTYGDEVFVLQMQMLMEDMQSEYENGNYVICGGEFSRDLIGNSHTIFHVDQEDNKWSAPFPSDTLFESFSLAASDNAPTARSTKGPYEEKTSFVSIVDGFIVSDNITVESCENLDLGFAYSDHNPVELKFTLA